MRFPIPYKLLRCAEKKAKIGCEYASGWSAQLQSISAATVSNTSAKGEPIFALAFVLSGVLVAVEAAVVEVPDFVAVEAREEDEEEVPVAVALAVLSVVMEAEEVVVVDSSVVVLEAVVDVPLVVAAVVPM